jgi:hypothetical protein
MPRCLIGAIVAIASAQNRVVGLKPDGSVLWLEPITNNVVAGITNAVGAAMGDSVKMKAQL